MEYEEGAKLAEEFAIPFYEVSSKERINVFEMLEDVVKQLKERADNGIIYKNFKIAQQLYIQNQQNTRNKWNI